MATLLYRLGRTAFKRWPLFLAAWLIAIIVVGAVAGALSKPLVDSFSIPGIPSERATDLQTELFGDQGDAFEAATVTVVVQAPEGQTLKDVDLRPLIEDLKSIDQLPKDVPGIANPVDVAKEQPDSPLAVLSKDGRTGTITFDFDVETPMDVKPATLEQLDEVFDTARESGLTVEANGQGMSGSFELGYTSELIGLGVALVVLVLTFGSLVGAGLPLINAIVGVGLGMTSITAATAFMDISSTAPTLATMIGLAVGIDYTLFILARYRTELHYTDDRQEAAGIAVGTAGSAVIFAGLTVIIALSALLVVNIPFLAAMGLAAALTVAIAVLAALTLLPAILGMLKTKAFGGTVRKYKPKRDDEGHQINNGVRFARILGRRPVVALLVGIIALGALALPVRGLYLAFPTDSTKGAETTQRKASDLIADSFGPGRESPLLTVVDARSAENPAEAFQAVVDWANEQDSVQSAFLAGTNSPDQADPSQATGGLVMIIPETGPDDEKTSELLESLRSGEAGIEEESNTEVGITGLAAIQTDVSERLTSALPLYLAVVVGLAFLLLMLVFRSLVIPLIATGGFLLSILATLGATVAVFQHGLFGIVDPQPIVSFMPIILIGIVFGLAMDYQVFLVSRMREAHVHGMSTRDAVVDGFRNSARVVVAAATIMIAVFSAFMLQPDAIIKSMGFALSIAIVLDAFLVRMVLVPATMYLLGERVWWLPTWLDRLLPRIDVEGEKLERSAWHEDEERAQA